MKVKIAVAEDNGHLAESIRDTIRTFDHAELLFVARDGQDLLYQLESAQPDIILMDINMPRMDGIESTRRVKAAFPQVRILMLTVFDEEDKIFDAILAGASGYLLKGERPEKLLRAIEDVMEGGAPMSAAIASKALNLIRSGQSSRKDALLDELSTREMEILEHMSDGSNYNQIAERLFISPKTVRKHVENIYMKLQVNNKVEAIRKLNR